VERKEPEVERSATSGFFVIIPAFIGNDGSKLKKTGKME